MTVSSTDKRALVAAVLVKSKPGLDRSRALVRRSICDALALIDKKSTASEARAHLNDITFLSRRSYMQKLPS